MNGIVGLSERVGPQARAVIESWHETERAMQARDWHALGLMEVPDAEPTAEEVAIVVLEGLGDLVGLFDRLEDRLRPILVLAAQEGWVTGWITLTERELGAGLIRLDAIVAAWVGRLQAGEGALHSDPDRA